MDIRLQVILATITICSLIFIINMVRKENLELKYSLVWIFINLALIVLSLFPNILTDIAILLGIKTPVNALFLIGIIFELIIIFTLTLSLSRNSSRVKKIAQEIALLKKEIELFQKELIKNKE